MDNSCSNNNVVYLLSSKSIAEKMPKNNWILKND